MRGTDRPAAGGYPMHNWREDYARKLTGPDVVTKHVRSGQRVFIGSGAAEPQALVKALTEQRGGIADAQIIHIMTLGVAPYVDPKFEEGFRHNAFFIGANTREAIAECRADYTPLFLSEIPRMFRSGRFPLDHALIQVSPPDEHGFMSYGVSVDIVKSGAESARNVIAQVNPRMPRVLGDAFIHVNQVDAIVEHEEEILESRPPEPDEVARRIGARIAELIEDGSTMQMGIGTIPDAVLHCLTDKKDLGVHTEMFSDGVIELVERGVITGRCKPINTGKITASFVLGTRRLYEWIHDNPLLDFHPTEYTNDPFRIARHDKMVSINSALEIDLTGQVCADSIGNYFYSGIGGQVDFVRGASRSIGGKPIIALPSTAHDGSYSRIVSTLKPGAGVVTSRGDVHYVVTEFGAADLHGKSIRERALALIHVAHPDFREDLMRAARERALVPDEQVAVLALGTPGVDALASSVITDDGRTIRVRIAEPVDEDLMIEAFYKLSPATLYKRFHGHIKRLPRRSFKETVVADLDRHVILVAIASPNDREIIVGIASYDVDTATNAAEIAFIVADEWQLIGIGEHLLTRLIEIARDRGIVSFTAEVLHENAPMLHLFHKCAPGKVHSTIEDGVYHISFSLAPVELRKPVAPTEG